MLAFAKVAMPRHLLVVVTVFVCWIGTKTAGAEPPHVVELDRRVLAPDDGLILGNGDLSVSVYQTNDRVIWRLGKGDVWDRRHDLSDDPKPLHIRELADGITVEGWKANHNQLITPTRGTKNPQRVKEVSLGPPSYQRRPYPCPKPVGELCLHLPFDAGNMKISQRLVIEQGRLEVTCSWPDGRQITLESFVTPRPNALVVRWQTDKCPVWFSVYRWADPPLDEYAARLVADTRSRLYWEYYMDAKVTPLSPPAPKQFEGQHVIEQPFSADPLYPSGFRYWLAPFTSSGHIEQVDMRPLAEARLRIIPEKDTDQGWLAVAVPTSSDSGDGDSGDGDSGDVEGECSRIIAAMADDPAATMAQWREQTVAEAGRFWSKSAVTIADSVMERLWYENHHVRRCIFRHDTVPPGLYMPSTVGDYSVWHGDYHMNYNFQASMLGNYQANHFEVGDAYFRAMDFMLEVDRKIARDYYGARGVFVQLTGFPIRAQDDPFGLGPVSRMAYMTGWAMQPYWQRYLYSGDKQWLREKGYPVIRDCALFYTDFLKQDEGGVYHAFPSVQQEAAFSDDPATYTDRPQVLQHVRYCLRAAILASTVLELDVDLRPQWQDRLDHLAPDPDAHIGYQYDPSLQGLDKWCGDCSPPQWGRGKPHRRPTPQTPAGPSPLIGRFTAWWLSHPSGPITALRDGSFVPERDFDVMRRHVIGWRRPNGLVFQASRDGYHTFVLNEDLSIVVPLQEMMLQSWDGILRIFPAWPKNVAASFRTFRAQGAFLVSASWADGQVATAEILSEVGGPCRVYPPWPEGIRVVDDRDRRVPVVVETEGGVVNFATQAGRRYALSAPPNVPIGN